MVKCTRQAYVKLKKANKYKTQKANKTIKKGYFSSKSLQIFQKQA
jgi:hypothetical protein